MVDILLIIGLLLAGFVYLLYKMNGRTLKGAWKEEYILWACITLAVGLVIAYIMRRAMMGT